MADDTTFASDFAVDRLGDITGAALERLLPRIGVVPFVWTAADDRFVWAAGADRLLNIDGAAPLPTSLRAYRRILSSATADSRDGLFVRSTVSPEDARDGIPYGLQCRLRSPLALENAPCFIESGRWWPDSAGLPVRVEGWISPPPANMAGLCAQSQPAAHPITGLLPRDQLFERLRDLLARLHQEREGSAAFLVVAINDLADINTNFGYEIGDHIIATVAQRIARRMRHADVIGHISGHKFGIVLHNCTESSLAVAAERFRNAVDDEPIVTPEAEIQVTICQGAVILPRNARDAETAAMRAEEALSEARASNGKRLSVFQRSPDRDQMRRRNLAIAEEIVQGLAEDRFLLAYQPVIDAKTREIVSYEALTRLLRRDGRIISAGPLVTTAERLGLIRRIDQHALRLVLGDLRDNRGLRLAVNVSPETITDPLWLGMLVDQVSADRDIARRLTVELTETAAFRDPEEIRRMAQTLRDIGCKVAIDDFGAGYTSMRILRDLEVDLLKIDGAYVRDILTNPGSEVFVGALCGIAKHFSIRTVAEWVQNEAAARRLAEIGVDMLQGRYPGEPLLRVTALTEPILARHPPPTVEEEPDGYSVVAGRLEGHLSLPKAPVAA